MLQIKRIVKLKILLRVDNFPYNIRTSIWKNYITFTLMISSYVLFGFNYTRKYTTWKWNKFRYSRKRRTRRGVTDDNERYLLSLLL